MLSINSGINRRGVVQAHIEELPHISDYRDQHPNFFDGNGIKCVHCGSRSIRAWGLGSREDKLVIHKCNHCGTSLYRTGCWTVGEESAFSSRD